MKSLSFKVTLFIIFSILELSTAQLECRVNQTVDYPIFDQQQYVTGLSVNQDWFAATNNSKVHLVNTKTNQLFRFFPKDDLRNKINNSDYFTSRISIYLPEVDVLVVAGNGAYAVFNATNPIYQNNTNIQVLQTPFEQSVQSIQQSGQTGFIIQYVNPMRYMSTGILITYNVTNSSNIVRLSTQYLDNFPQTFVPLNENELIYSFQQGYNEQLLRLPNLSTIKNITLNYNGGYGSSLYRNNDTTYYMNSYFNGTQLYFKNSSYPYFTFKQYANYVFDMNSLNNNNAYLLAVNNTFLVGNEFYQTQGIFNFTEIGRFNVSSNSTPVTANIIGLSSSQFNYGTNRYETTVIAGFDTNYNVLICVYNNNTNTTSESKKEIKFLEIN